MSARKRQDESRMRVALALARRGLGRVAPNPSVGCIIVGDGKIVGRGFTQQGGRPHAETVALEQAGRQSQNAEAYVTLEPCAHTGATGPCADALICAGIARAVVAVEDPDPRVSGKGIKKLRDAGITVEVGVLSEAAIEVNKGFFKTILENRPRFTLKTAASMDGNVALGNGQSQWITGQMSRSYGHMLRARHDAILVGVGTVLADDPSLDCRLPGLEERSPLKIILDSTLRTPVSAKVFNRRQKTILICENGAETGKYSGLNAEIVCVESTHDPIAVGNILAEKKITSVLIEGGPTVAASFLAAGMVDDVAAFTAGKLIGKEGLNSIGNLDLATLAQSPHFTLIGTRKLGPDMLASYVKAE